MLKWEEQRKIPYLIPKTVDVYFTLKH
jgi:hypothetical protein